MTPQDAAPESAVCDNMVGTGYKPATPRQIFVNLPVRELERSLDFFEALGFGFDPKFTSEQAACMIVSDNIYVMLLPERFFRTFIGGKTLCDARTSTESLTCIALANRAEVDAILAKAVEAGARTPNPPQDHGFMYARSFEDLDGHFWEFFHMVAGKECPVSAAK